MGSICTCDSGSQRPEIFIDTEQPHRPLRSQSIQDDDYSNIPITYQQNINNPYLIQTHNNNTNHYYNTYSLPVSPVQRYRSADYIQNQPMQTRISRPVSPNINSNTIYNVPNAPLRVGSVPFQSTPNISNNNYNIPPIPNMIIRNKSSPSYHSIPGNNSIPSHPSDQSPVFTMGSPVVQTGQSTHTRHQSYGSNGPATTTTTQFAHQPVQPYMLPAASTPLISHNNNSNTHVANINSHSRSGSTSSSPMARGSMLYIVPQAAINGVQGRNDVSRVSSLRSRVGAHETIENNNNNNNNNVEIRFGDDISMNSDNNINNNYHPNIYNFNPNLRANSLEAGNSVNSMNGFMSLPKPRTQRCQSARMDRSFNYNIPNTRLSVSGDSTGGDNVIISHRKGRKRAHSHRYHRGNDDDAKPELFRYNSRKRWTNETVNNQLNNMTDYFDKMLKHNQLQEKSNKQGFLSNKEEEEFLQLKLDLNDMGQSLKQDESSDSSVVEDNGINNDQISINNEGQSGNGSGSASGSGTPSIVKNVDKDLRMVEKIRASSLEIGLQKLEPVILAPVMDIVDGDTEDIDELKMIKYDTDKSNESDNH